MSATPHPSIAKYIREIEQPGIPWISTSHLTLKRLYEEHGAEVIQQRINDYFSEKRKEVLK